MIWTDHNAHLIQILAPPVPADAKLGIAGSAGLIKWQGDIQAHLEDASVEAARGNQRVITYQTLVIVPQNIPVLPEINDQMVFTMMRDQSTKTLLVRQIDDKFVFIGQIRFITRVA